MASFCFFGFCKTKMLSAVLGTASVGHQGYWRNRKRASLARTRYWDRNPDTPIIRYGVVGNISACHADARGSIPRFGVLFFYFVISLPRGQMRVLCWHILHATPHPRGLREAHDENQQDLVCGIPGAPPSLASGRVDADLFLHLFISATVLLYCQNFGLFLRS